MVAAAHPAAVEAGVAVLQMGGSAMDAAVAVQMMLGLVEPEASGLGGGAFLLHWAKKEGRLRSYDGRETAPAAVSPRLFLDGHGEPLPFIEAAVGGRAVGVPGMLRMLEMAHRRHGRFRWAELLQYAIFTAEEGWEMTPRLHALLEREIQLRNDPAARRLFYGPDGRPKPVGTRLTNYAYADTVRAISLQGADALYRGPIAADIVRAVRGHAKPGALTEADLASYRAVEREPLCGPYRAFRICSMAPPSSGGVALLQILGMLERTDFSSRAPGSEGALHLYAEASRLTYADRARYIGDPDFVSVPTGALVDGKYLEKRAALIGERAIGLAPSGDPEAVGTTHFTIVDAEGDVVSMTSTIEATFGSRIMVRGFVLNNELTDFDFQPNSRNEVEPRKRPRSSMAPAIVFDRDGEVRMAVGSPGGPFIIGYVAKALIGTLDWGLPLPEAVRLPNFANRNGATEIETGSRYEAHAPALRARGHEVVLREMTSGLHGVERIPGGWRGAADPRRGGVADGR
ncbi:MAG TPA: gamma-glutamyltransferase [Burkholderiales bacterium]|nr:gamma-glutamyltransferase [Burkholderiales bacterium]